METESGMESMESLTGKNILVTGGTGFVGSHLVEALIKLGSTVIVPYRSIDPRSYFSAQKLHKNTIMVQGDVKNFQEVFDIVTKYEIEYIFHLAAQAIVTTAYHNPLEAFQTNIIGTANILEAARLYGKVKGIVIASSDKAYGKSDKPYKESDALRGDHPYEVSKSAADLISQTYYKTYKLPVVITRFGNIYGEGDLNFSRIIPGVMKSLITKEELVLRSDGTHVRDYVYVKDVVRGYLFLLGNIDKIKGEAFNLSSNDTYSVLDVIKHIGKKLNKKISYTIANSAKNEIPYQHLSYEKIHKLGWRPIYSIDSTLVPVKSWYKKTIREIST